MNRKRTSLTSNQEDLEDNHSLTEEVQVMYELWDPSAAPHDRLPIDQLEMTAEEADDRNAVLRANGSDRRWIICKEEKL